MRVYKWQRSDRDDWKHFDVLPQSALHSIVAKAREGEIELVDLGNGIPTNEEYIEQARIIISLKEQGLL